MVADLTYIFSLVVPLFVLIGFGYFLRNSYKLDQVFFTSANTMVTKFGLPVYLFYAVLDGDIKSSFNFMYLIVLAGAIFITAGLALLISYMMKLQSQPATWASFLGGCFRSNVAYMGLPIAVSVIGSDSLGMIGVSLAIMVPIINVLSIASFTAILGSNRNSHNSHDNVGNVVKDSILKRLFFEAILNPITVGCYLGIIANLLGITFPMAINRSMELIGSMTLPLALICIGAGFKFVLPKGHLKLVLVNIFIKLLIYPSLIVALAYILPGVQMNSDVAVFVIMSSAPVAAVHYVFALHYGADKELAAASVVYSTLVSLLTFSGWIYFLLQYLG